MGYLSGGEKKGAFIAYILDTLILLILVATHELSSSQEQLFGSKFSLKLFFGERNPMGEVLGRKPEELLIHLREEISQAVAESANKQWLV